MKDIFNCVMTTSYEFILKVRKQVKLSANRMDNKFIHEHAMSVGMLTAAAAYREEKIFKHRSFVLVPGATVTVHQFFCILH